MNLSEMMAGKFFITDLGEDQNDLVNHTPTVVGRYAVWAPIAGSDRHQIVEVGQDLGCLMQKYGVSVSDVCLLNTPV